MRGSRPHSPWGTLFSLALIAIVLAGSLRVVPIYGEPLSWNGVAGAIMVALPVFIILRWLVSWVAGMVAALMIALAPPFVHAAQHVSTVPEGLGLLAFVCVLAGWRYLQVAQCTSTLRQVFSWLVIAVASFAVATLAWTLQPRNGLVAALLILLGFAHGAFYAVRLLRKGAAGSWSAIAAAIVVGIVAPAAGLFTAPLLVRFVSPGQPAADVATLLGQSVAFNSTDLLSVLAAARAQRPTLFWLMTVLFLWGVWRALRGGIVLGRAQKLPVPWLLLLFAAINLALVPQSPPGSNLLPVLSSTLLMCVFGVGDAFRGIGQSLILKPPQERTE